MSLAVTSQLCLLCRSSQSLRSYFPLFFFLPPPVAPPCLPCRTPAKAGHAAASTNGATGVSDMAGYAARVCGRAQRELLRYNATQLLSLHLTSNISASSCFFLRPFFVFPLLTWPVILPRA